MKKIKLIKKTNRSHWVGDGFPVRSIFSYQELGTELSPFLLFDYAGPLEFKPSASTRGVGAHPHRGFETVTIAYSGEVEHRDSNGGGGMIRPGDVQWMTAGSGLVHEEMHSRAFSDEGGRFEMIQLWVNLERKNKMTKPRYQGIKDADIPRIELPDGAGTLRAIAGEFQGVAGAAKTFSPVTLWELHLKGGHRVSLETPPGQTAALFLMKGALRFGDEDAAVGVGEGLHQLHEAELALFEREGDRIEFFAESDATALFLGGQPIDEPIVGYGPFVMNEPSEIHQAIRDFEAGKMGSIGSVEGSERA